MESRLSILFYGKKEVVNADVCQLLDRKIKATGENPTIGIILCKEENRTIVEFTLPVGNNTIFAKEYKLFLHSNGELKKQLG